MSDKWDCIDGQAGIFRAKYKVPGTTPYSTCVQLNDQIFLVYSPGPGLEADLPHTITANCNLLLLAPCYGHTLGVAPWQDAHPSARLFAPEGIKERILKKRAVGFIHALGELQPLLPDHVRMHVLPDNRFHEVWISIDAKDRTYWLMGDAFLNFETVEGNFLIRFLLGLYGIKPGLRMHKMFRLGLKDKPAFRQWALPLFDNDRQHVLLPCHREIYDAPDCGDRMLQIIKELS